MFLFADFVADGEQRLPLLNAGNRPIKGNGLRGHAPIGLLPNTQEVPESLSIR